MRYLRSEKYFPIIVGLHFVLWAVDLWLYDGSVGPQRVIGEVFSSWVVTVFAFNFLMATRARWVERIFGGLDKMYVIHRRSGVIAVVLLLLHFAVIPKSEGFSPGKPLGIIALALILFGVVAAASPALKRKIPYGKWLPGHRWMGLFYVIGVAHAFLVDSLIWELVFIRAYVFGMAAVGVGAWVYRAFFSRRAHPHLAYRVSEVRRPSERVVEATLEPGGSALNFTPGQFAFFGFDGFSGRESHPFTISGPPNGGSLQIAVKASGDLTEALHKGLEPGVAVAVDGPYGHFTQDFATQTDQIWVAGGIGITPFLAMAPSVPTGRRVTLYWCVGHEDEAFAREDLERVATQSADFEFVLWPSVAQGHLTADVLATNHELGGADVMICGPQAMKDALFRGLRSLGVPARQLHDEVFQFR